MTDTEKIQEQINMSHHVVIEPGTYVVGPLFLHSDMSFELKEGAILLATTDESAYMDIPTRVAGIEMDWYPAVLNCIDCHNVRICGKGTISGNGPYWYNKYWGEDQKGGMRKAYDERGLRFACDYDCKRPRNLLISNCYNIEIDGIILKDSGFWNLHILYSHTVLIHHMQIHSENQNAPSTDGIDIDSSYQITIDHVKIWCNDDSICVKSGRDADGLRVARPSYDIRIQNSEIYQGFGVTIGSEVSGGIHDIRIRNMKFYGTDCGFRIKSSMARKGYIRNISIKNLECENVKYLFHMDLNWNPLYCRCVLPENYKEALPKHYEKLIEETRGENTNVNDIIVENVKSTRTKEYLGVSRIFHLNGFPDQPIHNFSLKNVHAEAIEYGILSYVEHIHMQDCMFDIKGEHDTKNDTYDNR